jgi:hypothetical protein
MPLLLPWSGTGSPADAGTAPRAMAATIATKTVSFLIGVAFLGSS